MSNKIGRYEVLRRIGQGGMAEVFECKLSGIGGFDKKVVIKRILPHLIEEGQFVDMFLDEARMIANLNHPNVVHVYEIDEADGVPFIAMELVNGVSLQQIHKECKKQNTFSPDLAAKVMAGISYGLDHAHTAKGPDGEALNIVHRDVTPHNILVAFDGVSKLLDFGVAKATSRVTATEAGAIKGKIAYLAPEYIHHNQVDSRSDVFMAAVSLYQVALGELPFQGGNEAALLKSILGNEFVPPTQVNPNFPKTLEEIILWGMHADPEQRCPTAHSFGDALENYVTSLPEPIDETSVSRWIDDLFPGEQEKRAQQAYAAEDASSASGIRPRRVSSYSTGGRSINRQGMSHPSAVTDPSQLAGMNLSGSGQYYTQTGTLMGQPGSGIPGWVIFAGLTLLILLVAGVSVGLGIFLRQPTPQAVSPAAQIQPQNQSANLKVFLDNAEMLSKAKQFSTALDLLARARKIDSNDATLAVRLMTLTTTVENEAHLALAQRAMAEQKYDLAIEKAKLILDRNPSHAGAIKVIQDAHAAKAPPPAAEEIVAEEKTIKGKKGRKQRRQPKVLKPGRMAINTTPPALIYVDDIPRGKAPLAAFDLPAGRHVIEVRIDGYVPVTKTVDVRPGRLSHLKLTLKKKTKRTFVSSKDVESVSKKPTQKVAALIAKTTGKSKPSLGAPPPPPPAPVKRPTSATSPTATKNIAAPPPPSATAKATNQKNNTVKTITSKSDAAPAKPRLPSTFSLNTKKDVARTFGIIEKEIRARGKVSSKQAKGVTIPLARKLLDDFSPGSSIEVYPKAIYYYVIKQANAGKDRKTIAKGLIKAHRSGQLRKAQ